MTRLTFSIPGEPTGWSRATPVPGQAADGTLYVRMLTTEAARKAQAEVKRIFRAKYPDHRPWTGPVLLNFTVVFGVPKSFSKALREAAARGELYATKKPDKDNIEKLICDALNGIAFVDDQQVMGGGIKRYGTPPRIDVSLRLLTTPDVPATPGQKRAEARLQQELPLRATRGRKSAPHNAVLQTDLKRPPDLSNWNPAQRRLIEAAMARDEAAARERKK